MARAATTATSKSSPTRKATSKSAPKTTAKSMMAPKPNTSEAAPAKPFVSTSPVPEPMIVTETSPVVSAPEMKKVELVDAVVERSGIKKKDAKPAIEAALAILGEALADGRDLNLRPLGKVKVQRTKEMANGSVLTVRIRQASPKVEDDTSPSPIADAAE